MAVTNVSSANAYMARSFATAQRDMSQALARLGTQQRFQTASDDVDAFIRASQMKASQSRFDTSYGSANEVKGIVDAADGWASALLKDLTELQENLGDTEKENALLDSIAAAMAMTIAGHEYNGDNLTGVITMVDASTSAMTIAAPSITGTTGSVAADITALTTYIEGLEEWGTKADAVSRMASAMLSNVQAAEASIVQIDEAAEMAKYTQADIRQQSAVAVMAQANVSSRAILALFR